MPPAVQMTGNPHIWIGWAACDRDALELWYPAWTWPVWSGPGVDGKCAGSPSKSDPQGAQTGKDATHSPILDCGPWVCSPAFHWPNFCGNTTSSAASARMANTDRILVQVLIAASQYSLLLLLSLTTYDYGHFLGDVLCWLGLATTFDYPPSSK